MVKMAKLKVMSINARGLGTQHKRRDVMNHLKKFKCDIILLQDTHLIPNKVAAFNCLWRGKTYHSCYRNCSRGSSVLISSNVQHETVDTFSCDKGNFFILRCKIATETYLLGSIYGPNKDEPQFYQQLEEILDNSECDHVLLGGDFNFVINAERDSFGYVHEYNINAKKKFASVCNKHNLTDIWRYQNPTQQAYTWFTPSQDEGSRLDVFCQ